MMKYHTVLTSGLAAVLLYPFLPQENELRTLEAALVGTRGALTTLQDVQTKIQQDPMEGIRRIIAATEPPHLDERQRDTRLTELRDEVGRLQMQLDALRAGGPMPPVQGPSGVPVLPPATTTGIDDSVRRALEKLAQPALPLSTPDSTKGTPKNVLPEGPEYTADPVGQARAVYRLGRYAEALRLLEGQSSDPVALYWKARSLEKLERIEEAIKELEKVVELAPDSSEGRRAKTDLEFLGWKKGFVKKLPKGSSGKSGTSKKETP